VVVLREDVGSDRLNCQLYSGWRLGKSNPGVIRDRQDQVQAAGESIKAGGVGLHRGVGVCTGKGDGAPVVQLFNETLREEAVGVSESGSSNVGEGGSYALCKGTGDRVSSDSKEVAFRQEGR